VSSGAGTIVGPKFPTTARSNVVASIRPRVPVTATVESMLLLSFAT